MLGIALAAVAGGVQAGQLRGIKGDDDRILATSSEYPWSAIGRFNKAVGGFCTGTLIAPDMVLTAAHCLWNPRRQDYLPPSSLHFVAGYERGDFLAHSVARAIEPAPGFDPKRARRASGIAADWALVILEKPLGQQVGTIPLADLSAAQLVERAGSGTVLVQAGYSQDKAHVLSVHLGCRVRGAAAGGDVIMHDCDAVPGDSGSPLLVAEDGRFRVAAIHVATTRKGAAVGYALPGGRLIAEALDRHPDWRGPGPVVPDGAPIESIGQVLARLGFPAGGGDVAAALAAFGRAGGLAAGAGLGVETLARLVESLRP